MRHQLYVVDGCQQLTVYVKKMKTMQFSRDVEHCFTNNSSLTQLSQEGPICQEINIPVTAYNLDPSAIILYTMSSKYHS